MDIIIKMVLFIEIKYLSFLQRALFRTPHLLSRAFLFDHFCCHVFSHLQVGTKGH